MEFLYAIPLGLSLSFAAGPIFFVLIETSISRGKAAAFTLDLGAAAADLIFILIAYYGSQPILENLKQNLWLNIGSGLIVGGFGAYYLFKSEKRGQLSQSLKIEKKRLFFVKGFLLNFLNVGVLFFWLATTVSIGNLLDNNPSRMTVFYASTMAVYLGFDLFKIYFANRFQEKLAGRGMRMIEKIIGIILVLFGLFIMVRGVLNS